MSTSRGSKVIVEVAVTIGSSLPLLLAVAAQAPSGVKLVGWAIFMARSIYFATRPARFTGLPTVLLLIVSGAFMLVRLLPPSLLEGRDVITMILALLILVISIENYTRK